MRVFDVRWSNVTRNRLFPDFQSRCRGKNHGLTKIQKPTYIVCICIDIFSKGREVNLSKTSFILRHRLISVKIDLGIRYTVKHRSVFQIFVAQRSWAIRPFLRKMGCRMKHGSNAYEVPYLIKYVSTCRLLGNVYSRLAIETQSYAVSVLISASFFPNGPTFVAMVMVFIHVSSIAPFF